MSFNKAPSTFNKGINTDVDPIHQQEGTYRFGLNVVPETKEGELGDISTELGNLICCELPETFEPVGAQHLDTDDIVLYLASSTETIIGIQDSSCSFEVKLRSSCLNLKTYRAVDSEFRLKSGCERVLYFSDKESFIYSINLDTLYKYVIDSIADDDSLSNQEKIDKANLEDGWDCDKFKMFPNRKVPCIQLDQVYDGGGSLKVGTYQFAIRYLDTDLNPTNWFGVSEVVPIIDESSATQYYLIDGGIAGEGQSTGTGDLSLPPTNKSISLNITNLDTDFSYYELAVIESSNGIGRVSDVFIKPRVAITDSTDSYVFTGVDTDTDISSTVDEVVVPSIDIQSAEHIEQVNNRLLLSKTKSKKFNWAKFQRQASKIGNKYVVESYPKEDISQFSPKSASTYYYKRGYMRDEIYSFAIVWVFTDGTTSPAFHIPGRPKDTNPIICADLPKTGDDNTTTYEKQCLNIVETLNSDPADAGQRSSYIVYYTVDGVDKTFERTVINYGTGDPYNEFELECSLAGGTITVDRIETTDLGKGAERVDYVIKTLDVTQTGVGGSPNIPEPISGWDSSKYSYYPDDENLSYLGYKDSSTLERWEMYNTAYKLNDNEGVMAYYECTNNRYPDLKDCDGESIWGTDICGNSLAGKPIRHSKMPDSTLEPIQSDDNLNYLGVQFFNIQAPSEYADQIQGYYITRVHRNQNNKTVLDKGILDRTEYYRGEPDDVSDNDSYISYFRSDTVENNSSRGPWGLFDEMYVFHSPRGLFNRDFLGGTHVKLERYYEDDNSSIRSIQDDFFLWMFHNEGKIPQVLSREILDSRYLDRIPSRTTSDPVGGTLGGRRIRNYLMSIHLLFNQLRFPLDNKTNRVYYASIKRSREVYCNLDSLQYHRVSTCVRTASTVLEFGGDTFISKLDWSLQDFDTSRSYMSAYIESEINSELRHNGDTICDTYYQGTYDISQPNPPIREWILRYRDLEEFSTDDLRTEDWGCGDFFGYNPDYSKLNYENTYFPIQSNFDYCSECINEFPYRIYYSQQSFQEESVDNYKVFLTNNYSDLMGDQGEITNLFIDKDRLFAHAAKALWQIQTRPNEILTNEGTIFVGAGELLSIPPRKLVSTDYGYAGCTNKWSTVTCEHGTLFVDSRMGKVFLLTQGLEEISQNGKKAFFENNLKVEFPGEYKSIQGTPYKIIEPTGKYGVGIRAAYDPRYSRFIIHKRDFVPTPVFKARFIGEIDPTVNPPQEFNKVFFDITDYRFKESKSDGYEEIDFHDKIFFENRSFTVSYSLLFKSWTSFHSYMPTFMYGDHDTFYSFVAGDDNVWKHNEGDYTTYYGTKHPMIIDYVVNANPTLEKNYTSLEYISRVKEYLPDKRVYRDVTDSTFTSFYCYTRDQITTTSSLRLKTTPYQSIDYSPTISLADRTDNVFRISQNMRDVAINRNSEPLFTADWQDDEYSTNFNTDGLGNGYIDKVPNVDARDTNKNVYERALLRDKFLAVRLFYLPQQNYKLVFQISNMTLKPKNR